MFNEENTKKKEVGREKKTVNLHDHHQHSIIIFHLNFVFFFLLLKEEKNQSKKLNSFNLFKVSRN